jgi:clan AA aspartic protease (TIGR02281 family)
MRKLGIGFLILMTGCGLGWLMYQYWGTGLQQTAWSPVPLATYPERPAGAAAVVAPAAPAHGADILLLLQRNDLAAALERYESLQRQGNEAASTNARTRILGHARRLVEERRFTLAEQLLQGLLVVDYRDVEARLLLAEGYKRQQDLPAAIDQLYEARGYAWRSEMLQRITGRIRAMVVELATTLQSSNDQNALLALYQHLIQLEPDYSPWYMELATTQLALDDTAAARSTLQLVAQDPDVGVQAQALLMKLSVAFAGAQGAGSRAPVPEAAVGVPLKRSGNHFIVAARPASGRRIQLLVDTGASLTIFTPAVLEQRGIRYQDTGRRAVFDTANGPVEGPVYRLDSLAVGDWQVSPLEIGVLNLGSLSGVDGLLGMNFLSHFRFFIDQNEAVLHLSAN